MVHRFSKGFRDNRPYNGMGKRTELTLLPIEYLVVYSRRLILGGKLSVVSSR